MFFKQIEVGPMQNFSYIIGSNKKAAVVDPGWESEKLIKICKENNLKITKILLTHGHFDHAQEVKHILRKIKAQVYAHELEPLEKDLEIKKIKDGDIIQLEDIKIKVIHTPGHTKGGVCYLINNTKLITGDTLFVEAVGRADLPGSSIEELRESLRKLSGLDEKIEVLPGHDYGSKTNSTIKYEKENNPYMG